MALHEATEKTMSAGASPASASGIDPEREKIERLKAPRKGYHAEKDWHRFLLDAYAGTGGFEGKVRMPYASFWGAGADIYARTATALNAEVQDEAQIDTYLDRFPREDVPKFARRVANSQYPNYVEPIVDIRLSYMHRKPLTRQHHPEQLEEWKKNANGSGKSWDDLLREVIDLRAALVGWCPVLFDRTRPTEATEAPPETLAAEREMGVRTRAIPLFPANLLDWYTTDEGEFEWVKLTLPRCERPDPLGDAVEVDVIELWFKDRVQRYRIVKDRDGKERIESEETIDHDYGEVPIRILRHKPVADDPVVGLPMASSVSKLARKIFNYLSELDEHIRSCVFAFLQVPAKNQQQAQSLVTGNANCLPVDPSSTRDYKYVSPDPSVAKTLEERVATSAREAYRIGRQEYNATGNAGGSTESGIARAFSFESTNRAIADYAGQVAAFDENAMELVARMEGVAVSDDLRTTAPDKFDVEEMARELEDALSAVDLGLGVTAEAELRKRIVRKLLPNLDEETLDLIDEELDALAVEKQQEAAAQAEAERAALEGDGEGGPPLDGEPPPEDGPPPPPGDPKARLRQGRQRVRAE